MPVNCLFEYAVIRVVPRVEREEFLNVGVILYSRRPAFLGLRYHLDEPRLLALFPGTDIAEVREHLRAFEAIAKGTATHSPIARLDAVSRFRWLTARRSTVLQCSVVHPGNCGDPAEALDRLFRQMVVVEE